jgi:hypothetical protein
MHLKVEDFKLYALGQLPKERARSVESHVSKCPECDFKLKDALRLVGAAPEERRLHPRTATDEPGWMQVMEPPRLGAWEVRVLDVSKDGMSLRTGQHVSRGWKIKVRRGSMIVFGEVRYCLPAGAEFRVGVKIREVL